MGCCFGLFFCCNSFVHYGCSIFAQLQTPWIFCGSSDQQLHLLDSGRWSGISLLKFVPRSKPEGIVLGRERGEEMKMKNEDEKGFN